MNMNLRIVSLVPSITELLHDLGLEEQVVGITKFCVHPNHWVRSKTRIGGTKNISIEKIRLLFPTLVIASKEENVKEQVDTIGEFTDVLLTDIKNLDEALAMIQLIGEKTNRNEKADIIIQNIQTNFRNITFLNSQPVPRNPKPKTCYLIWKDPYMTIGADTFIHDMLTHCGFENVFNKYTRYPVVTLDDIRNAKPSHIFLSSEPYPFKEENIKYLKKEFPHTSILLVDGEYFSWYGSRLLDAAGYFETLINKTMAL
ncbi:MAG: helical backbone metal receptor [Chitinophagaceae bacterium]|nr:helical backbone metal receptor [Chitinophagaceae bacterium]